MSSFTRIEITRLQLNSFSILDDKKDKSCEIEREKDEHRWRCQWASEEDWSRAMEVERRFEKIVDWVRRYSPSNILHFLCESIHRWTPRESLSTTFFVVLRDNVKIEMSIERFVLLLFHESNRKKRHLREEFLRRENRERSTISMSSDNREDQSVTNIRHRHSNVSPLRLRLDRENFHEEWREARSWDSTPNGEMKINRTEREMTNLNDRREKNASMVLMNLRMTKHLDGPIDDRWRRKIVNTSPSLIDIDQFLILSFIDLQKTHLSLSHSLFEQWSTNLQEKLLFPFANLFRNHRQMCGRETFIGNS